MVDTGFGEKHAMHFIKKMQSDGVRVFGIKGRVEDNYRPVKRDSQPVKRSTEQPAYLYIAEVNQLKDDLAQWMTLRAGDSDIQPSGFMNFPEPRDGKYSYDGYFKHFESERRTEVRKNNEVVGYYWKKKNSNVANHFWDVRVYNIAAPMVFLDLFRRSDSRYKDYTWEDLAMYITG
jgi:phage terminase large subunit GpA-like protein